MLTIQSDVSLQTKNTLALPARAERFVEVTSVAQLQQAVALAAQQGWSLMILGGGSNVVLAANLPGLVVHIAIAGIELQANDGGKVRVRVGAGENWHQLVQATLERGWYGLENLSLIPGTVGAAPIQNIGAYGVELSDYLIAVELVDLASGEQRTLEREACEFGYRDSVFKGRLKDRVAITAVTLELNTTANLKLDYPALTRALGQYRTAEITPKIVSDTVCAIRRSKLPDPEAIPNAGSFFKNPVVSSRVAQQLRKQYADLVVFPAAEGYLKLAAGWLIEQAGWKGRVIGNVGVHQQQALVLVNTGGATGPELLALASQIRQSVSEQFGIDLDLEPRVLP